MTEKTFQLESNDLIVEKCFTIFISDFGASSFEIIT